MNDEIMGHNPDDAKSVTRSESSLHESDLDSPTNVKWEETKEVKKLIKQTTSELKRQQLLRGD